MSTSTATARLLPSSCSSGWFNYDIAPSVPARRVSVGKVCHPQLGSACRATSVEWRRPLLGARCSSSPTPGTTLPWLCLSLASCVATSLAAASSQKRRLAGRLPSARRRTRHVCFLFGGGKGKEEAKKAEAKKEQSEEGPGEEQGQEELSEAAQRACAKLQAEIDELKSVAEDKKNAHERLKLEVDNFRTRTRQELAAARGKAAIPVIKELLPIADEFDLAKQNISIEGESQQVLLDRFEALFEKMMGLWKGLGVSKLQSVGEPFNPELHEAISMIPSEEYGPEVVCHDMRAGWVLKTLGSDKPEVLRPALVCVSSGPGPS